MEKKTDLPEAVQKDLSLYFAPGERIVGCLSSSSGITGRLGVLWLVLTDRNLFFHTRETGKEAVVALLPRPEIRAILYHQHAGGVTLTFTPRTAPQNITKVSFPKTQRMQLESFCEPLAELITFQAETPTGRQIIEPPAPTGPVAKSRETPPAPLRHANGGQGKTEAPPTGPKASPPPRETPPGGMPPKEPGQAASAPNPPAPPAPKTKELPRPSLPAESPSALTPGVKLSRPSPSTGMPPSRMATGAPALDTGSPAIEVRLTQPEVGEIRFVLLATVASLVVGFLWYRFFTAISDS